ncbi:O-antigen ligase family protein [Alcanivorax sp.]|uniref:O-antigen ligase family protein n=1 Tax=Alcanivorax sp. TaxID=1872427 RepID=UPI002B27B8AB|nr:O-antigen ligase family protein [Alcanivorax sp.]
MIRFCRFSASILLFSFLAFLLVFQSAYAVLPVLAVVAALLCLVEFQRGHARLAADDLAMLLVLVLFALVWLADVWRAGQWPVGTEGEGRWLPVWPLLAALVLLAWRCVPPAGTAWWWGIALGALCAGGIAGHEHFWLGRWRPDNGMNAIPFGNLALLLGTLSLVALVFLPHALGRRFAVLQKVALVLAALAGLLASVLSGTRGGWVVFPALALLVCGAAFVVMPRGRMIALAAMLVAALLAMAFFPRASVTARVGQGVDNLQEYTQGEAGSSLGVRLEMWRAGWHLAQVKPVLGWGEGRLEARRDKWVAEGRFEPGISQYDQLHSDTVDTLARRGGVGLVTLLALYLVPLLLFWRYWRQGAKAKNREVCAFALCGVLLVVAFAGFGLSQSMLRDARGLSGFLGLLVACWCLLKQAVVATESQTVVSGIATD